MTTERRFYIQTFGCQMNDHDSTTLADLLAAQGHVQVDDADDADLILVNTCTVRDKADQKAYSQLGRYRFLKERKPELILGVGGCMAQGEGRRVLSRAPFVDLVFGTQTVHKVPDMVRRISERRRRMVWVEMPNDSEAMEVFYAHTRGQGPKAFVTVMQGCDNYCSYCIVPYVRGSELSRPSDDIVKEVERLVSDGVREVTLLGQNVNSYGQKGGDGADFVELVKKVAGIEKLLRVRFTTNHPKDLSDSFIELFAQAPKLMPHIHLPLQSGSDRILNLMNRRYTTGDYFTLIDKLRAVNPDIAITSDVIVGFPGESDEDFEATLAAMKRVVFDGMFSFNYSPRRGTRAAELEGALPKELLKARLAELQTLQKEHGLAKNRRWIGETRPVLVEGRSKAGEGQLMGRTPENKIVNFAGEAQWLGSEVLVEVTDAGVNSMVGVVV